MMGMDTSKCRLPIMALLIMALAGGLLLAQPRSLSDIEAGARIFEANCTACHGAEGDAVQGVDFARGKFKRVSNNEDLARIISRGIPGTAMPPSEFRARDMASLLTYLSSVRESAVHPAVAGDSARGQALFEGKGGCFGCHRLNGRLPPQAPIFRKSGGSARHPRCNNPSPRPRRRRSAGAPLFAGRSLVRESRLRAGATNEIPIPCNSSIPMNA
jgi:mono/diheme cytochrome c family protein